MPSYFSISVTFLDPYFHGRRDGGQPEWPPSPLRVFQALVAASGVGQQLEATLRSALKWLEGLSSPVIIAPPVVLGSPYRLSVPNNAMDLVAKAWSKGNYFGTGDANPATHRSMKTVRPVHLSNGSQVYYLWELPAVMGDDAHGRIQLLSAAARSIVALGWGIDLVVGNGCLLSQERADLIAGERWLPIQGQSADRLRAPVPGTLDALQKRHHAFLARITKDSRNEDVMTPPPPLTTFDLVGYRRATDPLPRPFAAFSILKLDASGFRPFDSVRHTCTVAGMMRFATRKAAKDAHWPEDRINTFVLGHSLSASVPKHVPVGPERFAYLPLPSIEGRGQGRTCVVGSVRRVLVTTFSPKRGQEIAWARQTLPGQHLLDESDSSPRAMLALISASDPTVRRYTQSATCWSTVTPVILPGYGDRNSRKVESLLHKAIEQAGFPSVLARYADLEWRGVGFRPGVDLASRYRVPKHLQQYPRLHVRIGWRDARGQPVEIAGPVCLGGGRFYGLGLFAAEPEGAT